MIFSTSTSADGSRFLAELDALIDAEERSRFSMEAGFTDPNNFAFENITRVLTGHAFPTTDHVEYGWAIKECGFDPGERYTFPMRLFAAAIYLYCYRVVGFDGNFQGEFLNPLVKGGVDGEGPVSAALLLAFLEWMYEHVVSHGAYSEYDLLLAWSVLAIYQGKTSEPAFAAVLSTLRQLHYLASDLRQNNDCIFPQPDDWLNLLENLPVEDAVLDAMLPIICGYDD